MSFRPLLSLTVLKGTEDKTRTVTYLPNVSGINESRTPTKANVLAPTATEKLFGAASNLNFPTAAEIVNEGEANTAAPGTSTMVQSRLTLKPDIIHGTISRRQLKQVQSILSRLNDDEQDTTNMEVLLKIEEPKEKSSCWARLCHWERHNPHSRPLYRDDAFYEGKIENLPEYQKTLADVARDKKTGLEYQLAVSRAVTVVDMSERRGVFTTAVRRVLATMMDPKLLKRVSYMLLCLSGFLTYLGYLVPYVYLRDRNKKAGIGEQHNAFFVSSIGLANAIGRFVLGALAYKFDPVYLSCVSCGLAGVATCVSHFSYDPYYQYAYCGVFGFFIASVSCLRSIMLVSLYGLEKLTNAMGMMIMFQGFGSLLSTPIAATIKDCIGYEYAFIAAGMFLILSSVVVVPVRHINNGEKRKETQA
ncbi:Monocarboxylate transporter 1 [Eumeta japonica]|uniref:Monocarboxylate transporter 1 n=1 Tax=Eumeta variegata TaxID=151549 RepID=A0A4C1TY78_EUMVA|nr:Monocarboxylate transporter 1 [Eumeta japonica]